MASSGDTIAVRPDNLQAYISQYKAQVTEPFSQLCSGTLDPLINNGFGLPTSAGATKDAIAQFAASLSTLENVLKNLFDGTLGFMEDGCGSFVDADNNAKLIWSQDSAGGNFTVEGAVS
jgi:hypothetical protein